MCTHPAAQSDAFSDNFRQIFIILEVRLLTLLIQNKIQRVLRVQIKSIGL